jgi:hypothetical protein
MNSKEITNLMLAYRAVYDEELREEFEEINEDFFGVDYLTEEDLEDIVEEVIYEMLDEGYNLNDIENIFEEFISEAKVTYGHDTEKPPGRLANAFKGVLGKVQKAVQSQGEKARASAIASTERANARRDAVKSAASELGKNIKGKINKVGSAVKAGVKAAKKELSGEAERESNARVTGYKMRKSAKSQAAKASAGNPFSEPSKPSKSSEKPSDPWKDGETNSKKPTLKVTTTSTKALPPGRTTKTGKPLTKSQSDMQIAMKNRKLTQRLGEEVEAWVNQLVEEGYDLSEYTWDEMAEIYESSGMSADDRRTRNRLVKTHGPEPFTNPRKKSNSDTRSASMVSSPEEPKPKRKTQLGNVKIREDIYDVILSHLIEEGYAETQEQAEVIMTNMSEEWREGILDEATIRSVTSSSGKKIYKSPEYSSDERTNISKTAHRQKRLKQRHYASTSDARDDQRSFDHEERQENKRRKHPTNIMNAKPGEAEHYGADEGDGHHYDTVKTDRNARKRRASGR